MVIRSISMGFWAAFLCATSICRADDPQAPRPNILFLYSDDQRVDTIHALGNPNIRTPNLDALVKRGTTLDRIYCMGSMQGAVCVPSRAMLMTGRSLFRVRDDMKDQETWPQAFGKAGYTTFATGKWHNQPPSLLKSFQRGKAIFFGGMGDPYNLLLRDISAEHTIVNERISGEHSVKRFSDAACEFLAQQKDGGNPFLCYVAFNAPHDPRIAPAEYRKRYNETEIPLPGNFLPEHPFDNGEMVNRDEKLAPWPRTKEVVQKHLADYYASIEYLDSQVGRILDALKESGQLDNTLVVFASDHGLAIGSHGLFGKQNLYDVSMRSPVILAGPGIPTNHRVSAFAYLYDLFPTLGDLCKIDAPVGSEGLSLAPVIAERERTRRTSIFTAYSQVQRAVRDERWKLIVYPQINRVQLFDLQADPDEKQDLSTEPGHAAVLVRLTALLCHEQARSGDSLPLSVESPRSDRFDFDRVKTRD